MTKILPANFLTAGAKAFAYVEKSSPQSSNLEFLTYGIYELAGAVESGGLCHTGEEALLFGWKGGVTVHLANQTYELGHYDVLYVPRDAPYRLGQEADESKVVVCRAPAATAHPVFTRAGPTFRRTSGGSAICRARTSF